MTDTLQPGPEMDAAVAAAVGWVAQLVGHGVERKISRDGALPVWIEFAPSVDVGDAIAALEATGVSSDISAMRSDQVGYCGDRQPWWSVGFCDPYGSTTVSASADTLPEAICRAILSWAEAEGVKS